MSYLRRVRPDVVKSRQWYERGARGARKRYMHILSAPNVDGKPVRMIPVYLLGEKKKGSLQDMRRRFIQGMAKGRGLSVSLNQGKRLLAGSIKAMLCTRGNGPAPKV